MLRRMFTAGRPHALMPHRLSFVFALALPALGCDAESDKESDAQREAAAAAMLGGDSKHSQAQKEDEERRKKAFAERKAKEEAEAAALKSAIDAVMGMPDPMPTDLNDACTQMLSAWETYIKNTNVNDDGAILAFYDNKKVLLGERKTKCMRLGSVEAAACSTYALEKAGVELKDKGLDILSACADKHAPGGAQPEGATPPTP